ncbi:MAG: hypothetical protein ACJAVF_004504, partial [Paraglaciecola sp.]
MGGFCLLLSCTLISNICDRAQAELRIGIGIG